jgi:hypothetical protein
MKWKKHGLLFAPSGEFYWMKKYAILPTPEWIEEKNCIRVYFASTNEENVGHITYLDCDADNPLQIIHYPGKFILGPGENGCFDDCGVNPVSLFSFDNKKYLSYIGFQRTEKLPYMMFSAWAEINNEACINRPNVPYLDRTEQEPHIRSAPFVLQVENNYLIYYVAAQGWKTMSEGFYNGKTLPVYQIKILRTVDFKQFESIPEPAIKAETESEFGFGRPWVLYDNEVFKMWYSVRTMNAGYRVGYAESKDGIHWKRTDNLVGIEPSATGWDSEMICYAAVIKVKNKYWMFYNGNGHGLSGMGLAEAIEWK